MAAVVAAGFRGEITQLTSTAEPLPDALWTEIRSQSAERLLQAVVQGTAADDGNLVSLYVWARPTLTPEQITTVLAGLVPPANQVSTWTYEQMRGVHARMNEAGLAVDSIHADARLGGEARRADDHERRPVGLAARKSSSRTARRWVGRSSRCAERLAPRAGRWRVHAVDLPVGAQFSQRPDVSRPDHEDLRGGSADSRLHRERLDVCGAWRDARGQPTHAAPHRALVRVFQ